MPPLRDRVEDIPVLIAHFLALRYSDASPPAMGKGVMKKLLAYRWPGNVRQLENEVIRASLLCDDVLTVEDLSSEIRQQQRHATPRGKGAELSFDAGSGTLKERVDRLETEVLRSELERYQGNKSRVARSLGLSRAGLNMKLKRLDIWNEA